jgi:hypothetical protein
MGMVHCSTQEKQPVKGKINKMKAIYQTTPLYGYSFTNNPYRVMKGGSMLYTKGYPLLTEQDFNNAMYCRLIISITENGEHRGNYCIKAHNKEVVQMMNDQSYHKSCDYKVVGYASFYDSGIKKLNWL